MTLHPDIYGLMVHRPDLAFAKKLVKATFMNLVEEFVEMLSFCFVLLPELRVQAGNAQSLGAIGNPWPGHSKWGRAQKQKLVAVT